MTPEGRVKKAIKEFLAGLPNCWFFMPAANGYGTHGTPDIVGCYNGAFFAIEVKRPGNLKGTTILQRMQLNAINNAHGYAIVADNVDVVVEMFERMELWRKMVGGRGL